MHRGSLLLVSAFLCAFALPARAAGWDLQPSPVTVNLYGVASSDASTWVAVGDLGTILRSTDGGVSWVQVPSPAGETLRAVSFNGSVGIAVGLGGRVLRTTDGGATWVKETKPTSKALYSVSMDRQVAVITGEEGSIFSSTDGGLTWLQHFAGTASVLFGVSVSGSAGVGVGGQGAVVMSPNAASGWGLTVIGSQLTFFYATSFVTPSTGWLVGSDAVLGSVIARSDSGGFTWTGQPSPTRNALFGVSFPALDTGTAVGSAGTVIRTTNGGQDWFVQDSAISQTLSAVDFVTADFGIAVGDGGTILRTTTGGEAGPWTNLGFGLAGVTGVPSLLGTGTLAAGSSNSLDLANGNPAAACLLFVSLSSTPAPFKGGTLVPFPPLLALPLVTLPDGTLPLPFTWPTGIPTGTSLWFQYAISDVVAIQKVSLSHAVKGTTP